MSGASAQLKVGVSVIIDAVNAKGKEICRGLARRHRLEPIILEAVVSDRTLHRKRIEAHVRNPHDFGEVTWERVEARRKAWTPWTEPTPQLDAVDDIENNVGKALR